MSDSEDLVPVIFEWTGDSMVPLPQQKALCDEQYAVHERYRLVPLQQRSMRSHNHYFAALNDAWRALPDEQAIRFPTVDHFRKWCLIQTGWHNRREIACSSKAEARRFAAFIRQADEYGVCYAEEAAVVHLTARSQSMKAMGKADFQQSKEDVLAKAAEMTTMTAEQLNQEAGRSA